MGFKITNKLVLLLFLSVFLLIGCNKPAVYSYVKINDKIIKVELAQTEAEQAQGLSNHGQLDDDQGMLFIFKEKGTRNFWMKEMNFPLDIIWIEDDRIIKIDKNLPPEGITPEKIYSSEQSVNYVLEIKAGMADKEKIKIGDKINYYHD